LERFAELVPKGHNKGMKILFLTKYGKLGASSRYRVYQYLPHLEKEGIRCDTSSLFTDQYLVSRYQKGRPSIALVLKGFLQRLRTCLRFNQYDLVVIEKELFPYVPLFFERWLLTKVRAYALDFDDALFHIYDQHRSRLIRGVLNDKFAQLMSRAALVTVGNPYLAAYAQQHARRVEILPTVIGITKYPINPEPKGVFTIGWIGTPNTQKYLQMIARSLQGFFEQRKGRLLAIGANSMLKLDGLPLEIVPWKEENEVALLQSINVGIMPLPDLPLERGKSGLKLLQYMACSRPVIASPVGVNADIVTHDVGYLAGSDDAWLSSLLKLADAPYLRVKMGNKGRQLIEDKYSLACWAPRFAQMLRDAAGIAKTENNK
jgi:glycosyltransferase involved in cell wall biosynthesis